MDLKAEDAKVTDELRDKRLVCEARFEREDIDRLRQLLLPLGDSAWTYPALTALLTVGTGIYYYDTGNFWRAFANLQSPADCARWGERFEGFLLLHESLESFHHLGGHRFVAPILAHGGIPQSCLPDFFSAVTTHGDPDLSGQEMLKLLETHPEWTVTTDKPVRRFLEHGGEVAEDFVARFLDLWRAFEDGDEKASSGLPERVVSSFNQWYARNRPHTRIRLAQFPRPDLRIEPSGIGVYIHIPRSDGFPSIGQHTSWEVLDRKWAVTREHEIPCPCAERYELSCLNRIFVLQGISPANPLMFFDPTSGKVITDPKQRRLPQMVWLVGKKDIEIDPKPEVIEELPSWPGFLVAAVNLDGRALLTAGDSKFEVRRPFFTSISDREIDGVRSLRGLPVYGTIPDIHWEGAANLSLAKNGKSQGNIDISAPEMPLLIDGCGEYDLHLRGPLGHNLRMQFLYLPNFSFKASPERKWPDTRRIEWRASVPNGSVTSGVDSHSSFETQEPNFQFTVHLGTESFELEGRVPKVQWRVRSTDQEETEFSNKPNSIALQELKRNAFPLFECEFGRLEDDVTAALVSSGVTPHRLEGRQRQTVPRNSWYFDLRAVRERLELVGKPERYELLVSGGENERNVGIVLYARPDWDISGLQVKWSEYTNEQVISVNWEERGNVVSGRWFALLSDWRPNEEAPRSCELLPEQRSTIEWRFGANELRPGKYSVRAFHAPWGSESWRRATPVASVTVDIYPELWAKTFAIQPDQMECDLYIEALFAHWYRPTVVPSPFFTASNLSPDQIQQLLLYLFQNTRGSIQSRPANSLTRMMIHNARATSTAILNMPTVAPSWIAIFPARDIVSLEPNDSDKAFLRELAYQYTALRTAAPKVKQRFKYRKLSDPMREWHAKLGREVPRPIDVVFLCEKFELFSEQRRYKAREYEELRHALLEKGSR